jgi:hypothetical protein
MVDMYVKLVQEGKRTLDQVPLKFRAEVEALLNV